MQVVLAGVHFRAQFAEPGHEARAGIGLGRGGGHGRTCAMAIFAC